MVSPVTAKGWPSSTTLYATRAGRSTTLVTPRAGRQMRESPGCTKPYTAVPPVCKRPACVLVARAELTDRGMPSCTESGPAPASAQSCPRIVAPSRHRAARTKARFARPLPADRAAMQKGTHGATGMHAVSALSPASCPHRGISHTVASSSRQVPREMQSCVRSSARASYRVYDQRTGRT